MARLITKFKYMKPRKQQGKTSRQPGGYAKYIGTREGVEKIDDSKRNALATTSQQQLIRKILKDFPDSKNMHEYSDYLKNPTVANASEFIDRALEDNSYEAAGRDGYAKYIALRPRAEKTETHGLFTDDGVEVNLSQVAEEMNAHEGNIWTIIISLRREDAERLGFNMGERWRWPGSKASTTVGAKEVPTTYTDNGGNTVYMFRIPKGDDGKYKKVIFTDGVTTTARKITKAMDYYDKFTQVDENINKFYKRGDGTNGTKLGTNYTVKGIRIEDYHQKGKGVDGDTDVDDKMTVNVSDLTIYKIMSDGSEAAMTPEEKAALTNFNITYNYAEGDKQEFGGASSPAVVPKQFSYNNNKITVTGASTFAKGVYTLNASYNGWSTKFDIVFLTA